MSSVIPRGIPFAQIPTDLVRDQQLDPYAKLVYCDLMVRANTAGRAWPSQTTIAEEVGISRSKTQQSLAALEDAGWISKMVLPTETGHKQRHSYAVHGTLPERLFELEPARHSDRPATEAGIRDGLDRPATEARPARHEGTNNIHEPQPLLDPEKRAPSKRARDYLWEAFVAVHGDPASSSERGKFNATVKKLKDADVTPEEYPTLVAAFSSKHNGLQPGIATVAERVGELRHYLLRGPVQAPTVDDMERKRQVALAQAEYEQQQREALA